MTRTCTVCGHPQRVAVDKAIIAAGGGYRAIACQFPDLGREALRRHTADHLLAAVLRARQEERADNGRELAGELRRWMDTIGKLFAACDEALTDPGDPQRYTLAPLTWEVVIHTEEERGEDRRPLRRKMRLSEALALVDGKEGVGTMTLVEAKTADPRKLIVEVSNALGGHLRLLGALVGKLQTAGTSNFLATPEWTALRTKMLDALAGYPQARPALAGALEGAAQDAAGRAPGVIWVI